MLKRKRKDGQRHRLMWAVLFSLLFHATAFVLLLPIVVLRPALSALRDKQNNVLKVALLTAILLHICLLFPLGYWLLQFRDEQDAASRTYVDLWGEAAEKEKTPEEELEDYDPASEIPDGQVVRAPEVGENKRPKRDTKFLAEKDHAVERETAATLRLPGTPETAPSPEIQGGEGRSTRDRQGGGPPKLTEIGPPAPDIPEAEDGEIRKIEPGEIALETIPLQPTETAMRAALAGTGLDHLEGVMEGDSTAINTRGWAFASFFNRVKDKVERYWHPDREFQARDPYGNIYGTKDRTTVLLVVLRADGSLKKAYIMDPSGASFLDDEAKEAVEKAAPFPNVPAGLLDTHDNLVKFTFHFIVQVGGAPVFRMRRY